MPWEVDFLPPHIMEFTNFVTSVDPYTGSGATSRFAMCPFLGIKPQNSRAFALIATSLASHLVQNTRARSAYFFAAPPLARLAPYFDRLCERAVTPTESRVPLTT